MTWNICYKTNNQQCFLHSRDLGDDTRDVEQELEWRITTGVRTLKSEKLYGFRSFF